MFRSAAIQDGTVYLGGSFREPLDVEGCAGRTSAGDADFYILKRLLDGG